MSGFYSCPSVAHIAVQNHLRTAAGITMSFEEIAWFVGAARRLGSIAERGALALLVTAECGGTITVPNLATAIQANRSLVQTVLRSLYGLGLIDVRTDREVRWKEIVSITEAGKELVISAKCAKCVKRG